MFPKPSTRNKHYIYSEHEQQDLKFPPPNITNKNLDLAAYGSASYSTLRCKIVHMPRRWDG